GIGPLAPFFLLGTLGAVIGLAAAALFQSLPRTEQNQGPLWWLAVTSTLTSGVGLALLITVFITVHPAVDTLVIAGVSGALTGLLLLAAIDFVTRKVSEASAFEIEIEGTKVKTEAMQSEQLGQEQNPDRSPVVVPAPPHSAGNQTSAPDIEAR